MNVPGSGVRQQVDDHSGSTDRGTTNASSRRGCVASSGSSRSATTAPVDRPGPHHTHREVIGLRPVRDSPDRGACGEEGHRATGQRVQEGVGQGEHPLQARRGVTRHPGGDGAAGRVPGGVRARLPRTSPVGTRPSPASQHLASGSVQGLLAILLGTGAVESSSNPSSPTCAPGCWLCSRVTAADVHDVEQRRDDAVFDVHEKRQHQLRGTVAGRRLRLLRRRLRSRGIRGRTRPRWRSSTSGRVRPESLEEESDQASGVVAGVVVASDTEVSDAAHQLVWLRARPDAAGLDCSVE